ncbi:LptF/LptG family permease [Hydrogenobacter sp. T-8]|uniref:LptF/LptG family permease n=1 Tax=Pampinifervens florentissimum TaxID=1632019 RepID=UPI0013B47A4A|nr:LptF/LptG family permease [Hydrogenobacter sp. T-8]
MIISLLFTFVFLIFQIIRLDQILFQLPLKDSLPFLLLWFLFYFSYMLPTAFFIAFAFQLFELKEGKKLHVIQSFGIRPINLYTKSIFMLFPVIFALSFVFLTLNEEDIGFVRRQLTLKYYALLITSIPSKSFQSFGQFTLYVEKRDGNTLEGIFFKFNEGVVVAKKARVEAGTLTFEDGSLLTQREGKTFATDFKVYKLSLNRIVSDDKKTSSREYLAGIFNALSTLLLMGIAYRLIWFIEHHHSFYYAVGLASVLYQLVLLLLKQKL